MVSIMHISDTIDAMLLMLVNCLKNSLMQNKKSSFLPLIIWLKAAFLFPMRGYRYSFCIRYTTVQLFESIFTVNIPLGSLSISKG